VLETTALRPAVYFDRPVDERPTERDIVALDGDNLSLGEPITGLCTSEGRLVALGTALVRI